MRIEKPKVAAVVVTYNRLSLLKECLDYIRKQSYKNYDIIVVNNGSTDGTKEFLNNQSDLIVINQENCGGAGGFYSGMKYMFEHGYDALWMMDDDGLAEPHQLENLITYSTEYSIDFANAMVVDRFNHSNILLSRKYYNGELIKSDVIFDTVLPFNGTLIWRNVIEKIGYIKREMLIWGDEREYTARVRANGLNVATISSALHYHPPFKGEWKTIIPFINKGKVMVKPFPRDAIFYRNLGYLDVTYGFNNGIKYIIYYILRLKMGMLSYFFKYYLMGRRNDYTKELPLF